MSYVYPARPVESGTLWVFNWGGILKGYLTGAYLSAGIMVDFTGELSATLFVPFIFADDVLKKRALSSKKW